MHASLLVIISALLVCRLKKYPLDDPNVHALGAVKTIVPPRSVCEQLQHHFRRSISLVKIFYRLHRDEVFYCKTIVKKRNSYTILYEAKGHFHYGTIIQFYVVGKTAVACIQQMSVVSTQLFGDSIPIVQVKQINIWM